MSLNTMQCPECDWGHNYWDEHEMLGELLLEHEYSYDEARAWINANRPGANV